METTDPMLAAELKQSVEISCFISTTLGAEARLTRTERLAVASLNLCLDHREATLLLINYGAWSSAFALMRPVIEACVRGCWFGFVATEEQIESLFADRMSTKLEQMARLVAENEPALVGLDTIAAKFKDQLDHFSHGSGSQLARWYNHESIGPGHTPQEAIGVLRFVDTVGLIACVGREKICRRPTLPFLGRLTEAASPARNGESRLLRSAA